MLQSIRRIIVCVALLTVLGIFTPAVVRADESDNAYWQRQAEITAELERGQTPYQGNTQDANAYWERQAEVRAAQERMP